MIYFFLWKSNKILVDWGKVINVIYILFSKMFEFAIFWLINLENLGIGIRCLAGIGVFILGCGFNSIFFLRGFVIGEKLFDLF